MDYQFKPKAMKRLLGSVKQTRQEPKPFHEFQIRDTSRQTFLLDVSRAKLLLYCFEAPHLYTLEALNMFVGSLHGASDGNPAILPILVAAFKQWHGEFEDGEQERAVLERFWTSFDAGQPIPDPVTTLKMFCTSQPIPLPDSLVHAIFHDPSFDITAYIDCLPPKEDF